MSGTDARGRTHPQPLTTPVDTLPGRPPRNPIRATKVIAQQNATMAALRIERDAVQFKYDAAQAEIEKLRLLIRQLQRGQFGRRSEKLDPDQLQLSLEDLEQTAAAAEAAQEAAIRSSDAPR